MHLNLTIAFTSNVIKNLFQPTGNVDTQADYLINALRSVHSNVSLVLNMEELGDLQIYGHGPSGTPRIVDDVLLRQSKLHVVGLNRFDRGYYDYSIRFSDEFDQFYDIHNYSRDIPQRDRRRGYVKFYTNANGFKYATVVRTEEVTIGIIAVESQLIKQDVLDYDHLVLWIEKEVHCLQQLGAKVIVLLSDTNMELSRDLMRSVPVGIDFILSVNEDATASTACNYHCSYHSKNDRVLMTKPSSNSGYLNIGLVQVFSVDLSIPSKLHFTAFNVQDVKV